MTAPSDGIEISLSGQLGTFRLDVAFSAPSSGVTALFGPSGCGKTSTLRAIAGLDRLPGTVKIAGSDWQRDRFFKPPHRREVGYVFQEPSLFPHLNVRGNLLYAHRGKPPTPQGSATRFEEMTELLGLRPLMSRRPRHLSGGERQRVAIGRALASDPKLLLMDEPLSALDADAKNDILPYLDRLHRALEIPVLYVTHDRTEVERLADHIVLLNQGRVTASGRLTAVQSDPDLPFARSRNASVTLTAKTAGYDAQEGLARFTVQGGQFLVPASRCPDADQVRLSIAADDVSLTLTPPERTTILNILPARIYALRPAGPQQVIAVLALGNEGTGERLVARFTARSRRMLELEPGMMVYAQIKGVALDRTTP